MTWSHELWKGEASGLLSLFCSQWCCASFQMEREKIQLLETSLQKWKSKRWKCVCARRDYFLFFVQSAWPSKVSHHLFDILLCTCLCILIIAKHWGVICECNDLVATASRSTTVGEQAEERRAQDTALWWLTLADSVVYLWQHQLFTPAPVEWWWII